MKVKICANRTIEDARMSLGAGADIIGLLVGQEHTSNDFIDKYKAKEICDYIAGRCDVSLVTHLKNADEIIELTEFIGNNIIQLHSDIEESEVEKIKQNLPKIKLVRIVHLAKDGTIHSNLETIKYADYYLMDSFNLATNQVGGTGLTYDWKKAGELIKKLDKPVFLAGGLNPENVRKAISQANPYGVDVNSGCKLDGVKNVDKVREFVANAKWNDIKAIIFDFDGTFFSGSVWDDWGNYLLEFIDLFLDGHKKYKKIIDNYTSGSMMAEMTIKEKGSAELFYKYQGDVIYNIESDDIVLVNAQKIKKLSKKYKLFIVSNSHYNYLIYHLDKFKIDKTCFKEIIDNKFKTEDISKFQAYFNLLNKYKLNPESVLVVGDSYKSDILPAKKLNIQGVLVDDASETNVVIDRLLK